MNPKTVESLVQDFDFEIHNGGFDQFFYNSAGGTVMELLSALEVIGALDMRNLLQQACGKFPGGVPPKDWGARQEMLLAISPDSDISEAEDAAFYPLEVELLRLVASYVNR